MAAYEDLRKAFSNDELRNRVVMATIIAAYGLLATAPDAADRAWLSAVFSNPDAEGKKVFMGILAANAGLSITNISQATDAAIQTQVEVIVPQLVAAMAGV